MEVLKGNYQHKRSTEEGKVPAPEDVKEGEIVLNLHDKAIYTKDADGNVVRLNGSEGPGMTKITDLTNLLS